MFASLARGDGGPDAIWHLGNAQYSKTLLLVRGVVAAAHETAHPDHDRVRDAYELLASIQEQAPDTVEAVLRYPSVGAWAGRALMALRQGRPSDRAGPAGLAKVAAAAAIRARFPCAIQVPVTQRMVTFPSVGQAIVPGQGAAAVLRSAARGAELVAGGASVLIPDDRRLDEAGWQGLRRISARSQGMALCLVIDDLDPDRMQAPSLAARLTEQEALWWQSRLREVWDVLCAHHGDLAAEILTALRVIVPLQAIAHRMRSATSREHFGSVGLSAPSGTLGLAVSLAHEVQHAKLCALQDVMRLAAPDDGRRYYAPWRDDPRPLSGLLQGAYAYLGVARFWRQQRHVEDEAGARHAHAEFARWRSAVHAVTKELSGSGQLTAAGQEFVSRMSGVVEAWQRDQVPAEATRAARRAAGLHAERWNLRHGSSR
jgi:uncharacterized protein